MKNIKKVILAGFLLVNIILLPSFALAQSTTTTTTSSGGLKNTITGSLKKTGQSANYNTSQEGEAALASLIGNVIKVILGVLGIILFALVVYGGFLWMTARGDDNQVTKAKSILQQAVIGLVIVVSAYAVASFVMTKLTGAVGTGATTTTTTTP